jgi:hypothetical protein
MHDVDFLPNEYRRSDEQRRRHVRRLLVAAGVAAVLAAGAWVQHRRASRVAHQLAACEPARAAAAKTRDAFDQFQSELRLGQASANLVAYLRHPWPRTRIVAALLAPLPNEITFDELQVHRNAPPTRGRVERRFQSAESEAEEESADLPPAARDLQKLREELDSVQTIVTITGVTTESAALHQYLGALREQAVFSKSQLQSIEADPHDPTRIRFRATVVVRPGYGQLNGPAGPVGQAAAGSDRNTT